MRLPRHLLPQASLLGSACAWPGGTREQSRLCLTVDMLPAEGRSVVTGDRETPARARSSVSGRRARGGWAPSQLYGCEECWAGGTAQARYEGLTPTGRRERSRP